MISREKIAKKLEALHEHFNFKDFIGLSALIFGLLLSNTSLRKTTAHAVVITPQPAQTVVATPAVVAEEKVEEKKLAPKPKKTQKKISKKKKRKKKAVRPKRAQQKTAARADHN